MIVSTRRLPDDARRLSAQAFGVEFRSAWAGLERRFLKLECWQEYREQENSASQDAYLRGDLPAALALLREEAEADRFVYEDVRRRKLDYARIRLVQRPLTEYLRYELLSYRIRAGLGETILLCPVASSVVLPNEEYFDVLLFDQHTALVHDYGAGDVGLQNGGWVTHDRRFIAALGDRCELLRFQASNARPLRARRRVG